MFGRSRRDPLTGSDTVELVKGWFDRWNRGDRFTDEEVHPDVEIVSRLHPEPFRGLDAFRNWAAEIDQQFREWELVTDSWHDAGDGRVAALGHIRLVGHASGVEYDQPTGWLIEVKDEKLRRMEAFAEPSEALAAAGLEEGPST